MLVTWHYPSPHRRPSSVLGVRPVRVERHNPYSIATLRQTIARVALRQLSSCPLCGLAFISRLGDCRHTQRIRRVGRRIEITLAINRPYLGYLRDVRAATQLLLVP